MLRYSGCDSRDRPLFGQGLYIGFQNTQKAYRDLLAKLQDISPLSDDAVRLARLHYHATFDLMPFPMRSFCSISTRYAGRACRRCRTCRSTDGSTRTCSMRRILAALCIGSVDEGPGTAFAHDQHRSRGDDIGPGVNDLGHTKVSPISGPALTTLGELVGQLRPVPGGFRLCERSSDPSRRRAPLPAG